MPYRSVAEARKKISSLQGMSTPEVKKFISIFNALIGEGMAESKAIPIAISRSKKDKKEVNKSLDMKDKLVAAILYLLNEVVGEEEEDDEGGEKDESESPEVSFVKSFNEELKQAYEIVYYPFTKDAHNQWMSDVTVRLACENFNDNLSKGNISANLFHLKDTDQITIVKTWIQEMDSWVGKDKESSRFVPAGTWVSLTEYKSDHLWGLKKSGVLGGVSIGGYGNVNGETGEITNVRFDPE